MLAYRAFQNICLFLISIGRKQRIAHESQMPPAPSQRIPAVPSAKNF